MIFARARSNARKVELFLFSALLLAGAAGAARGQSALDGFDPNANGIVRVVVVQPDGKILLGGDFTTLAPNGGVAITRNRIARLYSDGTLDTAFNPNANDSVNSIAIQADGRIVVGGNFTAIGGQPRNHIARVGASDGLADSFNPDANGVVRALVVQANGRILTGGDFTVVGGQTRNRIARLDPATGLADPFNPNIDEENTGVFSLAVQADGKVLAGGVFSSVSGQLRTCIARLDPSTGTPDSFDPSANGVVYALAVQPDGKILAGGAFNFIGGGQARGRIARLDPTTGLPDSFNPNANNAVYAIAVQADGKILAGGTFSGLNSIGGLLRNFIARLDPNTGSADSFHPNANGFVHSIAVQTDGKILAGGSFTTLSPDGGGAVARNRIARMLAPPCTTFSENFDGVTAPALPTGWVATNIQEAGTSPRWVTSASNSDTPANDAFVGDLDGVSDKRLDTPPIAIGSGPAQLSFRNRYNFDYNPPPDETFWDGGVLEVSSPNINGGAFTDVTAVAVGGSFVTGGYTGAIDDTAMNPLAGRLAWGGNTNGVYINSVVNLGPNVSGQTIKLRFRMGQDLFVGAPGWRIDTISIVGCSTPAPTLLANISTRFLVGTGDNALIGGFILTGTQSKKVIVRAIGPSLNIPGQLANPTLELFSGNTLLGSNDDWQNQPAADKQAVIDSTIPPTNNLESALVRTLPANGTNYTAIVRGANNTTGIAVVEVYDLDTTVDSRLANISTRGFVQTGDTVLIAGTIVLGSSSQKVIIRAIGPSLSIAGKLLDPTLELRDANGGLLRSNDNWRTGGQETEIIGSTVPPTNDFESAFIHVLPGNGASYTAIVRGVSGTTGIAVVEVYALN